MTADKAPSISNNSSKRKLHIPGNDILLEESGAHHWTSTARSPETKLLSSSCSILSVHSCGNESFAVSNYIADEADETTPKALRL